MKSLKLSDRDFNKLLSITGAYQLKMLYTKSRIVFSHNQFEKLLSFKDDEPQGSSISLSDREFFKFLPITGVPLMRHLFLKGVVSLSQSQVEELQQTEAIVDKTSFLK